MRRADGRIDAAIFAEAPTRSPLIQHSRAPNDYRKKRINVEVEVEEKEKKKTKYCVEERLVGVATVFDGSVTSANQELLKLAHHGQQWRRLSMLQTMKSNQHNPLISTHTRNQTGCTWRAVSTDLKVSSLGSRLMSG